MVKSVNYINYFGNTSNAYFYTLDDGKNIENAKEEMFTNTTDSNVKKKIDSWYASNMLQYKNYLEDVVWCNDRTLVDGTLYSKDYSGVKSSYFVSYTRNVSNFKPSLVCSNIRDSFTVDSSIGNGKLIYPIGLLTADEYTLAGSGNKGYSNTAYLFTGKPQWTLSPDFFDSNSSRVFVVNTSGILTYAHSNNAYGVRPSVSLKSGVEIFSGDGSVNNPYVIG